MKRETLVARAEFLHQKQEAMCKAAREFARQENANPGDVWQKERARCALLDAGIAYGIACKRYLGGRTS